MSNGIEEKEEVQEREITEKREEMPPEEEAAVLIREDIESALRLLRPPAVPWRARIRFNTDGSIDVDIGSADLVSGLCIVCPPCCNDPG